MSLHGYLDGLRGDAIVGWACDRDLPHRRMLVTVHVDGVLAGRAVARERRVDLERAGIGDGAYGFRVPWPAAVAPVGPHDVCATVAGLGRLALATSDWAPGLTVADAEPDDAAGARADVPRAVGRLQVLGGGGTVFDAPDLATFDHERGARPLDAAALQRAAARIAAQSAAVRAADGRMILAVVPCKLQIHADRLPPGAAGDPAQRPSAQLLRALRRERGLECVDLTDAVQASRRHGKVFLRSAPQLTWLGAAHAARAVLVAVARQERRAPEPPPPLHAPARPVTLPPVAAPLHAWMGRTLQPVAPAGLTAVAESDVGLDETALGGRAAPQRAAIVTGGLVRPHGRLVRVLAAHFADAAVVDEWTPDAGAPVVIRLVDDAAVVALAGG